MMYAFLVFCLIAAIAVIGGSSYVVARNFSKFDKPRPFEFLNKQNSEPKESPSVNAPLKITLPSPTTVGKSSPSPSTTSSGSTLYKQPQGKYTILLPSGWSAGTTISASTYSTTKFTGPNGTISITTGSGKDPIGGCSDTNTVTLADRTVPGCLLLQKDGSQILTRVYTKDSAGVEITVEATINSPLTINRPAILSVIGTVDIL